MGSYRPDYSRRDSPPPPPPPDMPPLPWGPPPSSRPYQFGANPAQTERSGLGGLQRSGFSFHPNDYAPRFPHNSDNYRPSYADEQRDAQNEHRLSHQHHHTNRVQRTDRGHRGTYRGKPTFHPSSRPLLFASGSESPQRRSETSGSLVEAQRFRNADEVSNSDEAIMNGSDNQSSISAEANIEENEPILESNSHPALTGMQLNGDLVRDDGLQGHPNVVEASLDANSGTSESVPPKWSNPEYFTVLPPPDDSSRRKKDVVKLIRKARVALTKTDESSSQVIANDDFISLDLDEAQFMADGKMENTNASDETVGQGIPGAPLGPSQPNSQGFRSYQSSNVAPGTQQSTRTASQLGPPPPITSTSVRAAAAVETVAFRQKRKRDNDDDDDVLIPRPPKKAKGRGVFSNGRILDEWRMDSTKDPVPWLSLEPQVSVENPGLRLHQEICDFYSFVKPQEYEHIIRMDTLQRIRGVIQEIEHECDLRCFGSFAAGLYLPNADMDLVIVSRKFMGTGVPSVFQSTNSMYQLGAHLRKRGIAEVGSVEIIHKARVPIIKFVDQVTSLKVDISFENDSGLIANDTFQQWREDFPAMPVLVTLIKQFLMMRGLNEVAQGGIGGFSVTCLVVSLLQNLPRVQCREFVPEQHLGEMLLEFLDFYGNQLDIARTGLSMKPPGYFSKQYLPNKFDRLAIMDPNKPDNDISGGSRHITVVFAAFSECHDEILRAMCSLGNKSLLGWMVGGNYSSILWQRQRLRRLYKQRYGDGVDGESTIRDALQQGSHYVASEPVRENSNARSIKDSKSGPEDTSPLFWNEQIHELKGLVRSRHMSDYARTVTASENRARYALILEEEKKLLEELAVIAKETYKNRKETPPRKRKKRGESQEPTTRQELAAATHAMRRRIVHTWNPADPTEGKRMRKKTLESARETYYRLYTLLQSILDANPEPGWQEIAFGKDQRQHLTKDGQGSDDGLNFHQQRSEKAPPKQEPQTVLLGSSREQSETFSNANASRSRSSNLLLTRQGSSTQDAIMID